MKIAFYDTSLTDAQWELIQPMLPARKPLGRPPTDRRRVLDAILHVVKTGVQWRMLPSDFTPWQTVFHSFRQWAKDNVWEAVNARLRGLVRKVDGRDCRPTAAILDSQSVKSDPHGGGVGYDAAKKIKGRKRHLLVDRLGLVLAVFITPANRTERDGGQVPVGEGSWMALLAADALGGRGLHRGGVCQLGKGDSAKSEGGGGETLGCRQGVQSAAEALGGGAHLWLADEASEAGPGLREDGMQRGGVGLCRHDTASGQEAGLIAGVLEFSDRL